MDTPICTVVHSISTKVTRIWMIQAKLSICLICLTSIAVAGSEPNGIEAESVWKNNRDYTFMWWAYGLRDPSRVFHIQTSHYDLSFDFDDFELNTFGPIVNAASEEKVLYQDNCVMRNEILWVSLFNSRRIGIPKNLVIALRVPGIID